MTSIKFGDRVTIRTWNSMKNEFGLRIFHGENAISCRVSTVFISDMRYMTGHSYKVTRLSDDDSFFVGEGYTLLPEMVVGFQP